jgi:succinate dehydrogenase/fumarate reductase-like Fe-S protein
VVVVVADVVVDVAEDEEEEEEEAAVVAVEAVAVEDAAAVVDSEVVDETTMFSCCIFCVHVQKKTPNLEERNRFKRMPAKAWSMNRPKGYHSRSLRDSAGSIAWHGLLGQQIRNLGFPAALFLR